MATLPYRPNVKLGSLRQTTKKMMATKASGAKVGDDRLKKFLKEDKGLRRVAYGDKSQTVESWKGRHFIKGAKEKIEESSEYRETLYGKKTSAEKAFRDTVKQEIREEQAQTTAPSKDELARQKRIEQAKQNLRQYERAKEIEKEQGKALGGGQPAPKDQKAGAAPARAVPFSGGGHVPPVGRAGATAGYASPTGGQTSAGVTAPAELPPLFAVRGRVLRVDTEANNLFIHVLNAPPELAIFIGRDLTLHVPEDAKCLEQGASIACTTVRAADFVDARGRTLNGVLEVDELQRNNSTLPGFITQFSSARGAADTERKPPDELAIG